MKIQIIKATYKGKPIQGFKVGDVVELNDASAMHWIRRGVAEQAVEKEVQEAQPQPKANNKKKKKRR